MLAINRGQTAAAHAKRIDLNCEVAAVLNDVNGTRSILGVQGTRRPHPTEHATRHFGNGDGWRRPPGNTGVPKLRRAALHTLQRGDSRPLQFVTNGVHQVLIRDEWGLSGARRTMTWDHRGRNKITVTGNSAPAELLFSCSGTKKCRRARRAGLPRAGEPTADYRLR